MCDQERRAKEDVVFHALGTTDELNSFVGYLLPWCCCVAISACWPLTVILHSSALGRLAREYCEQSKNGLEEKLQIVPLPSLHEESCGN